MGTFDPQHVQRVLTAELELIFATSRGKPVTDEAKRLAKQRVAEFLTTMKRGGDIPDNVNPSAVRVSSDGSTVIVDMPVMLRLYIEEGEESVRTRRFVHDCKECEFLGHGLHSDLYYCSAQFVPTVIARTSSVRDDYESGMSIAERMPVDNPLGLAFHLAGESGFLEAK